MIVRPDIVVRLLAAQTSSLVELANISERDPFTFYQGADLSGVDLSGQDLRGLNFSRADLTGANLDNVDFDPGAFNGSRLDRNRDHLIDQYEYFADEILNFPAQELLAFTRFRPGLLDVVIEANFNTVGEFAKAADVGVNTLRKARQGGVVAMSTAQSILSALMEQRDLFVNETTAHLLRQPLAMLVSGGNNARFNTLDHDRLATVLALRGQAVADAIARHGPDQDRWRDTPEMLEMLQSYLGTERRGEH